MLTAIGFLTIGVILYLLVSGRTAAIVAFGLVPIAAAFLAGFGPSEVGEFVTIGLSDVVSVVALFVFAILYFGVVRDAGMFDPIVDRILGFAGRNPVNIALGTAVLGMVAHLDGAGATTFLITIPAFLPLYKELGMSKLVLATIVGLSAGTMNLIPWGGPTLRAATTVDVPANELWVPLIPAQIFGLVVVLSIAYYLGLREKRRLGGAGPNSESRSATYESTVSEEDAYIEDGSADDESHALRRPSLFWINVGLTVVIIAVLVSGIIPPAIVFMVGLVLALLINYPGYTAQMERVDAHARPAMLMASILLAAGAFLGIIEESGMVEGMAQATAAVVPAVLTPLLPVITGAAGVPLSFLFGPDAYYFGVLPILAGTAEQYGISSTVMAQASIIGEETVGFPVTPLTGSFFLLVGLSEVNIGDHIRHIFPWAMVVSLSMLVAAVVLGVIPLWAA